MTQEQFNVIIFKKQKLELKKSRAAEIFLKFCAVRGRMDIYMKRLENEAIELVRCADPVANLHTHNFLELAYVTKGEARHFFAGTETVIRKGDFFVVDYGISHGYESIENAPFEVINCLFLPTLIDGSLQYCPSFGQLLKHYLIRISPREGVFAPANYQFRDGDGKILLLLEEMISEYEKKETGYVEVLRSLLVTVMIRAVRSLPHKTDEGVVASAERIIRERYAEHLTLTALARKMNYSIPHFCRKFYEETGMHFSEYLERVRIEEACRLLLNTDKRIIDVAPAVGYNDLNSFQRVFKAQTGKSPREFKKGISQK